MGANVDLPATDREEDGGPPGSLAGDLARSPVLHTLVLMTVGWAAVWWYGALPSSPWTAAPPVDHRPLTLVAATYAHGSFTHLAGNAVVVAIMGTIVARKSSTLRFHVFFISTGAASTAAAIWLYNARPAGEPAFIIGASGAALALLGYFIAANVVSETIVGWAGWNWTTGVVIIAGVTAAITIQFTGPNVANVSHGAGALLGLIAGRFHLLRVR